MAQPPVYNRYVSFTNLQVTNPTGQPQGPDLDVEFNNIKATLDAIEANLKLIQRDDGALANASVGVNQLSSSLTVGFTAPVAWQTGVAYVSSPASTVFEGGKFYSCAVSHTSGTFATDLAAGDWVLIADLTAIPLVAANQIAVTPSGTLTTDVQGSLQALDAGKAATSHTHPSSAISDSTAAGRAMLTAANVTAQQTLLGLGSQAFVNSPVVTAIAAQLALAGVISPATLNSSVNDWSPTGWSTTLRVRLSTTGAFNITGFAATTDGDIKILENIGANTVTITHDSSSSAAANRVTAPADVPLNGGAEAILIYDGTSARWRVLSIARPIASSAQATALSDDTVVMTPAKTSTAIGAYNSANSTALQHAFNPFGSQLYHVREQQAQNTASSNAPTSGAWRTVVLNTDITNEISGASRSTNTLTLPAGTYHADARMPVDIPSTAVAQLRLENTSDSSLLITGVSSKNRTVGNTVVELTLEGRFTLAAPKTVELQVQVSSSATALGATNFGTEVYVDLMLWKVA